MDLLDRHPKQTLNYFPCSLTVRIGERRLMLSDRNECLYGNYFRSTVVALLIAVVCTPSMLFGKRALGFKGVSGRFGRSFKQTFMGYSSNFRPVLGECRELPAADSTDIPRSATNLRFHDRKRKFKLTAGPSRTNKRTSRPDPRTVPGRAMTIRRRLWAHGRIATNP